MLSWIVVPFVCVAVAATLAPLHGQQPAISQGPIIKSKPNVTVPVYTTVLDPQRRLVPGLVREDFQIFDNEKPQELSLFDNEVRPINVVIMLDTSGSMTLNIEFVKQHFEKVILLIVFVSVLPLFIAWLRARRAKRTLATSQD